MLGAALCQTTYSRYNSTRKYMQCELLIDGICPCQRRHRGEIIRRFPHVTFFLHINHREYYLYVIQWRQQR